MNVFTAHNWYWIIGGDTSKVYSSATNTYVSANDATYLAWRSWGNSPPDIATEADIWMYVSDKQPDWMFDGTTFSQPAIGAYTKSQLTAYAANARWRKEIGGISLQGIPVATDDRSKQMILGARLAAQANPDFTTSWVGTDGNVYPLNGAQLIGVSDAVLAHVSNCFTLFATVKAAIADGSVTTITEVDAVFA